MHGGVKKRKPKNLSMIPEARASKEFTRGKDDGAVFERLYKDAAKRRENHQKKMQEQQEKLNKLYEACNRKPSNQLLSKPNNPSVQCQKKNAPVKKQTKQMVYGSENLYAKRVGAFKQNQVAIGNVYKRQLECSANLAKPKQDASKLKAPANQKKLDFLMQNNNNRGDNLRKKQYFDKDLISQDKIREVLAFREAEGREYSKKISDRVKNYKSPYSQALLAPTKNINCLGENYLDKLRNQYIFKQQHQCNRQ